MVKNLPANAGDTRDAVPSLGQGDPLEKEMATYSSILSWRIPVIEQPGGLWSMGLQRVDTLSMHTHTHFLTILEAGGLRSRCQHIGLF